MKKTAFLLLVVSCLVFGVVASAHAYWEGQAMPWGATAANGSNCSGSNSCHGAGFAPSGPHGGFSSATDSCKTCHHVHNAGSSFKLLPTNTEVGICITCHDFSYTTSGVNGGGGVYGAIRARGAVAQSRHNIDGYNNTDTAPPGGDKSYVATSQIPGGQTGNSTLPANPNGNYNLVCTSCHTPHGNTSMATWSPAGQGGRIRHSNGNAYISNRILHDDIMVKNGTHPYTVYSSLWCAACHKDRHDSSTTPDPVNNHPVDTVTIAYLTTSAAEGGQQWFTLQAAGATITTQHLAGFSREATMGWAPECQQCHNDYLNVEQASSITTVDGWNAGDNPRFQTFPHETMAKRMVVESGDDLCLNCHPTKILP